MSDFAVAWALLNVTNSPREFLFSKRFVNKGKKRKGRGVAASALLKNLSYRALL
jgi:hypothetical protein